MYRQCTLGDHKQLEASPTMCHDTYSLHSESPYSWPCSNLYHNIPLRWTGKTITVIKVNHTAWQDTVRWGPAVISRLFQCIQHIVKFSVKMQTNIIGPWAVLFPLLKWFGSLPLVDKSCDEFWPTCQQLCVGFLTLSTNIKDKTGAHAIYHHVTFLMFTLPIVSWSSILDKQWKT